MQTNKPTTDNALQPPVQRLLNSLHERYAGLEHGEIATYIPELSKANPDWFGIAVVTMDGHVYTAGDCDIPFTIQSISKPFLYGLALEDRGWDYVLGRIGLEPTGDAFNAISLDPETGRPANPMINAGAIATTALIEKKDGIGPMFRILEMFARYTGRELSIDEEVYRSESQTGHRNRAISHLLLNFNHMPPDPEIALDRYFRQCAIQVTCRDLAVMAACLANGGVNPVTGQRALDQRYVDSVLSVMETCGMYNYAGEWMYRVGMPAKSGVAGGLLGSLVGQLGIGVFSPPLDVRGNSVRGVMVCDDLSREYRLHMLNVPNLSRSTVRAFYNVSAVRSKRHRSHASATALTEHGQRIIVFELQGQLTFASVEGVSRQVIDAAREAGFTVIDFKRVQRADPGGIALFADLMDVLLDAGETVVVADVEHVPGLGERVEAMSQERDGLHLAENRDRAIESCEDRLLAALSFPPDEEFVPLQDNEFFAGLDSAAIEALIALSKPASAKAGATIVAAGDEGRCLYLFTKGRASELLELPDEEHVRLATNPAGTAFGELLLVDETPQPASLVADTDIEFHELPLADIRELCQGDPELKAAILRNVAVDLAGLLRIASNEVRALSS